MIAKEEAIRIKVRKQRELDDLQRKLDELETRSRFERKEFERQLDFERKSSMSSYVSNKDAQEIMRNTAPGVTDSLKLDAKERVKAKFRTRYAERLNTGPRSGSSSR